MAYQKASITSLPWDALREILDMLTLQDILNIRQSCKQLHREISSDKQLWNHILNSTAAADIESCVKHALLLEKSYNTPRHELSIQNLYNKRAVTWVKLIRGMWCLAASSDTKSSSILLWNLSKDQNRPVFEFYLPGPVIDGLVDDGGEYIRCAITVGTSSMYTTILEVGDHNGKPLIHELSRIRDASHIRLFSGSLIGYASKKGDDTYAHVSNWNMSKEYRLLRKSTQSFSPLPQDPVLLMVQWNGMIVSYCESEISLHKLPSSDSGTSDAIQIASTRLPHTEERNYPNATVIDTQSSTPDKLCVSVAIQDKEIQVDYLIITIIISEKTTIKVFRPKQTRFDRHEYLWGPVVRHCVGSTGRRMFQVTMPDVFDSSLSMLFTSSISISNDNINKSRTHGIGISFSRHGLPIPALVSALDFDDGWGLIAMGSSTGELCIGFFLHHNVLTENSAITNLPNIFLSQKKKPDTFMERLINPWFQNFRDLWAIEEQDIPCFYDIIDKYPSHIPLVHRIELTQSWCNGIQAQLPPGWSNNWAEFECFQSWIHPFPRWGITDEWADPNSNISLYYRYILGAVGKLYPVAYNKSYGTQVVFRIGQRMYISKIGMENLEDDEFDLDPEVQEQAHRLGVLPFTYNQFLKNPHILLQEASNRDVTGNMSGSGGSGLLQSQLWKSAVYSHMLREIRRTYMKDKRDISLRDILDRTWNTVWRME